MKTFSQFVLIPIFGREIPLVSENWSEIESELYDIGYTHVGEVKVIKRTYQLISEEPQIVNTDNF